MYQIKTLWLYPVALFLGLLQAFAFDTAIDTNYPSLSPISSFLSLLGFLYFIQYLSLKKSLIFAYCFGLAFLGWGLNWIYISMASYGGAPLSFAVLANAGVIIYLALYWPVGVYLICRFAQNSKQRLWLAAPVFALLEWIRSFFLIGFPWLSIGYAWIDSPLAIFASLGGVFLVSFMAVLSAVMILLIFKGKYNLFYLLGLVILTTLMHLAPVKPRQEKPIKLAIVQGNMPVITEYDESRMNENLIQYAGLTKRLLAKIDTQVDLVVWPESAIPYLYDEVPDYLQGLHDQQQKFNFELISGVAHGDWSTNTFYNTVLLQSVSEKHPTFYFKQHLLPFGEYLPFRRFFSFFKDYVDIPMSDFSPGPKQQPLFDIEGKKISPSICFEAVFGDEIRQNASRSDFLLNLSNDAWFGRSKAQSQHLNIARMRAIENNKTLIRATNNGLTAIILPTGHIEHSLPPFKEGILIATVKATEEPQLTVYARLGDKPWVVLFILFAGLPILVRQYL